MSLSKPYYGKESVPIPSYKDKINKNTQQCTKFVDLTSPYELGFRALKIKVIPQLEVVDFYHGGRAPEYEYDPKVYERAKQISATDIKKIMSSFKSGQISFVGPAGSGKTTLLKLISNQVLAKEYENLAEVEVVHYIQCRDLRRSDKTTIKKFLFHNTNPSIGPEDRNEMTEFALKNPEKVLFILDSLDTLQYTIDGVYENIIMEDRASPEVVLWNFISGNLFPGCRIITSSREHSIRNYEGNVRAGSVIALVGLTPDSMKRIISGYLGEEEATQIMEYLKTNAPSLYSLCSTPAFLAFTLISLKSKVGFVPNTMSGIMAALLQCLIRSPHALAENIEEVVKILQKLAFAGTKERRVLFSVDELASCGLKPDEVKDLTIFVPGGVAQKVLIGSYLLYFSHQTLQEWLTALHIAEMPTDDFKHFLSDDFHTEHFYIVRRFLCGIILHPDVIKATSLGDSDDAGVQRQEKRKLLMDNLEQKLQHAGTRALLELFTAITEAGDGMKDIVSSCISEINMSDIPLSTTDAHVLASIAAMCPALYKIKLRDCNLNAEAVNAMWNSLKVADVKITELNTSYNTSMGEEGYFHLGKLVEQCGVKMLDLEGCDITAGELGKFLAGAGSAKIARLNMGQNTSLGEEGFYHLGRLVRQCEVVELRLGRCNITTVEMGKLVNGAGKAKIRILDVSLNETLSEEGFFHLGMLAEQCLVEELEMSYCGITALGMSKLLAGVGNAKITALDISSNTGMGEDGLLQIGRLVDQCGIQELKLRSCNITAVEMRKFLAGVGNAKLMRLDMSFNKVLVEEGFFHLGKLIEQCEVQELKMTLCGVTGQKLSKFASGAGNAKIRRIVLSNNKTLVEEGFLQLGRVVEQCGIRELELSYCGANARTLRQFLDGSGNAKLSSLEINLSEFGREDVGLLKQLLQRVDDYIIVHQTDISLIGRVVAEGDQVWRQEFREEEKNLGKIRCARIKSISDNQDNMYVTDVETLQEKKTEPGPTLEQTSVKQKVIGVSGGNIELRGNKVTFPEGALLVDTNVTVSLSYDPCMWPEGFICLAPVLDCDLSGAALQKMAEVEMTTWCTAQEEGVLVQVMGRSDEDGNWRILGDIPITNLRKVSFKTSHFSPVTIAGLIAYVLGLFGRRAAPLDFRVSNQVFYDEEGLFVSVLYLNNGNESMDNVIREEAKKSRRCEQLLPLSETITTRVDDNIKVMLCSDDESFTFTPEEGQSVPVAKIVTNVKKQKLYKLQPRPQPGRLDMTYKLLYGATEEEKHSLPVRWPLRTFSQDQGIVAGPSTVHHHHGAELRFGHLAANQLAVDRSRIDMDGSAQNAAGI